MSADHPAPSSPPVPKALFGYDVIDVIGGGAGSTIYVVSDPGSGQIYAMKHVKIQTEKDVRFVEQVENEFEVSRTFSHPALRKSVALKLNKTLFRKPTEAALVMELFDGIPLNVDQQQDVGKLLDLFIQVAKGLNALHLQEYVHCDLKPNNILVDSNGTAKIIDFGQTCKIGTVKQRVQGTPDFIAPEQVKCKSVGIETDVFNFGATLYWALCGRPLPTLLTTKKKDRTQLTDGNIPTPQSLNPNVVSALSGLVMECVQSNAGNRPDDLKDIARRLEMIQHSMRRQETRKANIRPILAPGELPAQHDAPEQGAGHPLPAE
jgi:serine/threonine protein kinase